MLTVYSPPTRESMADTLDQLKLEMVSAYDRTGEIDIADWTRRYSAFRDELLDFWMWLKGTPRSSELATPKSTAELGPPLDRAEVGVYAQVLRDACLAVTFGTEWLKPAVNPQREALAGDLETLRRSPRVVRRKSVAFPKAVVCTWIVAQLQPKRPRVTRLAVQKVMYVLEEAMSLGIFTEHGRKRLGPYDYRARYKDAEPIATKKGWLRVSGTTLSLSGDLSEVWRYAGSYLRSSDVAQRLVEQLAPLSDDQLETVATVHPIARDLNAAGRRVTSDEIANALAESAEWKDKLTRANFASPKIEEALQFLLELRLVSHTR